MRHHPKNTNPNGLKMSLSALVKLTFIAALGIALALGGFESSEAKKPRKLSMGAYISGAKIAMNVKGESGRTPRPDDALALLDSCLMWYEQVPEAYFWKVYINSSLAHDNRGDEEKYREYLKEMVLSTDSLRLSCDPENKDVKKKRKKKCEEQIITADSIRQEWFVEFYNEGQDSRTTIRDDLKVSLAEATEEDEKASLQEEINEEYAKAIRLYELAGSIYPKDTRYLMNLAEIHTERGDFEKAIPLQVRAVEQTKKSDPDNYLPLLNDVAYSLYEMKQYDSAAAIFKTIAAEVDDENRAPQFKNVVACYSLLDNADSVMAYNYKILELTPADAPTLATVGGVWFNKIQALNLARTDARNAGDDAKAEEIQTELNNVSDSARMYLQRAFEADPQDAQSIELYAITSTLVSDFESALKGWTLLTELKPDDKSYWIYVGDNCITLQRFTDAIPPYEKAVELDPTNVKVWQNLVDLYKNNGQLKESKAAAAKVAELGG